MLLPPTIAVLYVRKATESNDLQVLSLDSQIDELFSYAAKAGVTVSRIYRESQSAKAPGRPVFEWVMRELTEGRSPRSSAGCSSGSHEISCQIKCTAYYEEINKVQQDSRRN